MYHGLRQHWRYWYSGCLLPTYARMAHVPEESGIGPLVLIFGLTMLVLLLDRWLPSYHTLPLDVVPACGSSQPTGI